MRDEQISALIMALARMADANDRVASAQERGAKASEKLVAVRELEVKGPTLASAPSKPQSTLELCPGCAHYSAGNGCSAANITFTSVDGALHCNRRRDATRAAAQGEAIGYARLARLEGECTERARQHGRAESRLAAAERSLARSQQSVHDYERLVEQRDESLACADKLRADAEQEKDAAVRVGDEQRERAKTAERSLAEARKRADDSDCREQAVRGLMTNALCVIKQATESGESTSMVVGVDTIEVVGAVRRLRIRYEQFRESLVCADKLRADAEAERDAAVRVGDEQRERAKQAERDLAAARKRLEAYELFVDVWRVWRKTAAMPYSDQWEKVIDAYHALPPPARGQGETCEPSCAACKFGGDRPIKAGQCSGCYDVEGLPKFRPHRSPAAEPADPLADMIREQAIGPAPKPVEKAYERGNAECVGCSTLDCDDRGLPGDGEPCPNRTPLPSPAATCENCQHYRYSSGSRWCVADDGKSGVVKPCSKYKPLAAPAAGCRVHMIAPCDDCHHVRLTDRDEPCVVCYHCGGMDHPCRFDDATGPAKSTAAAQRATDPLRHVDDPSCHCDRCRQARTSPAAEPAKTCGTRYNVRGCTLKWGHAGVCNPPAPVVPNLINPDAPCGAIPPDVARVVEAARHHVSTYEVCDAGHCASLSDLRVAVHSLRTTPQRSVNNTGDSK